MSVNRRDFVQIGMAAPLMLGVGGVRAQSPVSGRPPRILMITFRGQTDVERGFRSYLDSAGLQAEFMERDAKSDAANVAGILQEAVDFKPDLIYTWGTGVTLAVTGTFDSPKQHPLSAVPVVFALVAAPVQAKIVPRLDGQGRNVTGAVHVVPTDVQLRAMQSYRPFKKVGVLYTSSERNSKAIVAEVNAFASRSGLTVIERTFASDANGKPTAEGIEERVAQIKQEGAEWLYLLPDTFLGSVYSRVTPAALEQKLPTFGAAELAVRSGGALVGLVSRYVSVGQLAGAKAVDILRNGKQASALPIETLKRFSLIVNMGVARSLGGVYPPIEMLNYAEVINVGKPAVPAS
jgi:putative ABC transport system substrate-binding protein